MEITKSDAKKINEIVIILAIMRGDMALLLCSGCCEESGVITL